MNKLWFLLGIVYFIGLASALDCGYIPTNDCTQFTIQSDCEMYYLYPSTSCTWSGSACATGTDCVKVAPVMSMNLENLSINSTESGALLEQGDFTHAYLKVFEPTLGYWWIAVLYVAAMAHIYMRTQHIGIPVMLSMVNFLGLSSLGVLPPEFSVVGYGFVGLGIAGILYFAAKGDGA